MLLLLISVERKGHHPPYRSHDAPSEPSLRLTLIQERTSLSAGITTTSGFSICTLVGADVGALVGADVGALVGADVGAAVHNFSS